MDRSKQVDSWAKPPSKLAATRDAVHIWQVDLSASTQRLEEFGQCLSTDERLRSERLRSPAHRDRCIRRRAILRTLLARYLGRGPSDIAFGYNEHGKPELSGNTNGQLEFNVTHSEQLLLIAISNQRRLGIDVERPRPGLDLAKIAGELFSSSEIADLQATQVRRRDETFLRLWTRKEAVLKALGTGMATAMNRFVVSAGESSPKLREASWDPRASRTWALANVTDLPHECIASVCVEGSGWTLKRFMCKSDRYPRGWIWTGPIFQSEQPYSWWR